MKRLVAGAFVAGALTIASSIPTSLMANSMIVAAAELHAPTRASSAADIVSTARAYLGSRYATIGDSPATGFSCIGFVHFVFAQNGINVPYDIPAAWDSAPHVQFSDLMPGDILFYSNTVFAGLSHVAIYIGNGQMIGADNFQVGVHLDNIYDAYWMAHYYGATRPLATVGVIPAAAAQAGTPTATASPSPAPQQERATASAGTHLQTIRDGAAVYSGPGYQYTSIGTLPLRADVTVVGAQSNWYDVKYSDPTVGVTYGFINAANLGPASTAAIPTATPDAPTASAVGAEVQVSAASAISGANRTILVVRRGPLNVRSGPGRRYAAVGSLKKGAQVLEIEQRGDWAHIQAKGGLTGWVARSYMAAAPSGEQTTVMTAALSAGSRTALVTAPMLYVRSTPASNGAVLTVLFSGESVRIIATQHAWDNVRLRNGSTGWAYASYLLVQ